MHKEIQEGKTCALKLDPESPSAIEFGEEVLGKVLGREQIDATGGTMDDLYPNRNRLNVILVEDEAGLTWKVPERDVNKIVCRDEDLCD